LSADDAMTGFILELVLAIFFVVFVFMVVTGVLVALILGLTTAIAWVMRFLIGLLPRRRRHLRRRVGWQRPGNRKG
jgi:hypothetical protein